MSTGDFERNTYNRFMAYEQTKENNLKKQRLEVELYANLQKANYEKSLLEPSHPKTNRKLLLNKESLLNRVDKIITDKNRKLTERKQRLQENENAELSECTFIPRINKKSASKQRTIDDLFDWQKNKTKRLEEQVNQENQEPLKSERKSRRSMCGEKVEDRLLKQAVQREEKLRLLQEEVNKSLFQPKINKRSTGKKPPKANKLAKTVDQTPKGVSTEISIMDVIEDDLLPQPPSQDRSECITFELDNVFKQFGLGGGKDLTRENREYQNELITHADDDALFKEFEELALKSHQEELILLENEEIKSEIKKREDRMHKREEMRKVEERKRKENKLDSSEMKVPIKEKISSIRHQRSSSQRSSSQRTISCNKLASSNIKRPLKKLESLIGSTLRHSMIKKKQKNAPKHLTPNL